MDALAVVDTMGVASVPATRYYVRHLRRNFEQPLEAHFHNDFGLANANSLAAVEEGAEVVHSTVLGTGERAGMTATEQIVLGLELLYGFDTGVKLDRLYELGCLVAELTGHAVPENQPVVGDRIYQLESGIVASWWQKVKDTHPTEVVPILPSLLGRDGVEIVSGKGSGADNVSHWLDRLGLQASPEQVRELVVMVKDRAMEKKQLLSEDEFQEMAVRHISG